MSRGRRAVVLLGLAAVLGVLAASDVARREDAINSQLAPLVNVVVAHGDLTAGKPLRVQDLALRRIPARFAPVGAATDPGELVGERLAIAVPRGGYLAAGQLDTARGAPASASLRPGERAVEVIAIGSPELVTPGVRVDVVVTRENEGGGPANNSELALENVEVINSRPVGARDDDNATRVAATLRVTVRQAVYLAAAQAFARNIRILPRGGNDNGPAGKLKFGNDLN